MSGVDSRGQGIIFIPFSDGMATTDMSPSDELTFDVNEFTPMILRDEPGVMDILSPDESVPDADELKSIAPRNEA